MRECKADLASWRWANLMAAVSLAPRGHQSTDTYPPTHGMRHVVLSHGGLEGIDELRRQVSHEHVAHGFPDI